MKRGIAVAGVRLEQINHNVGTLAKLPKVERGEMCRLDRAQAVRLRTLAPGRTRGTLLTLDLDTGVRPGELFALPWPDADLVAGTV